MISLQNIKYQIYKLYDIFGFYILWIFLFYSASYLHTFYCTPRGILGFLTTPLLIQAPHCVTFRWVLSTGTNYINVFWGIVASYFVKKMIKPQEKPHIIT